MALSSLPKLWAAGLAVAVVAPLVSLGCNKEAVANKETVAVVEKPETAAPPTQADGEQVPEPQSGKEEAPVAAAARVEEPSFSLALEPKGPYQAGQRAELALVLEAKADYKVNDKYPFKFKLKPSEGVTYPSDVVKQDAMKVEPKRGVMTVSFTPQSAGDKRIAGQFSFSVCTEERCLIEKRDLDLTIQVK